MGARYKVALVGGKVVALDLNAKRITMENGETVDYDYVAITPDSITLDDGRTLPQHYAMILPAFRGASFIVPIGLPNSGQMTEAMGMAVSHNIAVQLGAISKPLQTPTLEAICFAEFGDTGILYLDNHKRRSG